MTDTADRIRDAVVDYVADHPASLDDDDVDAIRTAEPFRNDDGNLRLGPWLLENRGGDYVLTRTRCGDPATVTAIYLEETPDGDWRVTDVGEEHYHFD